MWYNVTKQPECYLDPSSYYQSQYHIDIVTFDYYHFENALSTSAFEKNNFPTKKSNQVQYSYLRFTNGFDPKSSK